MFLKRNTSLHIILPYDSNGVLLKSYINTMRLIIASRASFCAYLIVFHYPIIYKFLLVLLGLLLKIVRRIYKTQSTTYTKSTILLEVSVHG